MSGSKHSMSKQKCDIIGNIDCNASDNIAKFKMIKTTEFRQIYIEMKCFISNDHMEDKF